MADKFVESIDTSSGGGWRDRNQYMMLANSSGQASEIRKSEEEFKKLSSTIEGVGLLLSTNTKSIEKFVENLKLAGLQEDLISEILKKHSKELENLLDSQERVAAVRSNTRLQEEKLIDIKTKLVSLSDEEAALEEKKKTARDEELILIAELLKQVRLLKEEGESAAKRQEDSLNKQKTLEKAMSSIANGKGASGTTLRLARDEVNISNATENVTNAREKMALAKLDGNLAEYKKAKEEEALAMAEKFWAESAKSLDGIGSKLGEAVASKIVSLGDNLSKLVENGVNLISEYGAKMNFRLNSISENAWEAVYEGVHEAFGVSPFVKQETLLKNIASLIDQGIVYNVEQRAYIAEFAKNILSTFSSTISALNDTIRVLQADTTAARLGLQKSLNDYFTEYYSNSEYMLSAFSSVDSSLKDIVARTDYDETTEIEYIIQKWLGALYSVGADSSVVTGIGSALNLLGSGLAQSLVGNLYNNLLAISASKANLDYALLLTTGFSTENVNQLLAAMVSYLADIADNTEENNVVASAYSSIFGTSLSTLLAAQTLMNSGNFKNLYDESLDYEGMIGVTNNQLLNYKNYLPITTMISNAWSNVEFSTGMNYANNPLGYLMVKAVDLVDNLTGGGPTIDLLPWGIGTDVNVMDMVKSTMFGLSLISSLVSTNWNTSFSPNVEGWYDAGGVGSVSDDWQILKLVTTGHGLKATSGSSLATIIGNTSTKDVNQSVYDSAGDTSEEILNSLTETDNDIKSMLVSSGEKGAVSKIRVSIEAIDKKLEEGKKLVEELTSIKSDAINVNLQYIEGNSAIDNLLCNPWKHQDWQISKAQIIAALFGEMPIENGFAVTSKIETQTNNTSGSTNSNSELALKLLLLIDDQGIPVRVESTDSMSNLRSDLFNLKNR